MVTLHKPTSTKDTNGALVPTMVVHKLQATKDTRSFKSGETDDCYIAKMTDGRFQVFTASFMETKHHEVFSEKDLHESFNEL